MPRDTSKSMKMYCIFASESIVAMKGNRGKLAAQAGHAYLHAFWDAIRCRNVKKFDEEKGYEVPDHSIIETALAYKESGAAVKICLYVEKVTDLLPLLDAYKDKTGVTFVRDAGKTVFDGPTVTCIGIGPIREEDIGADLKALKVLI